MNELGRRGGGGVGVSGSSFLFQNSSSSCFDWKFNFVGLLLTWNNFDL